MEWASDERRLLGIEYHTHSVQDYALYEERYSATHPKPVWMDADFGKHGDNTSEHGVYSGRLRSFWIRSLNTTNNANQALLEIGLNDSVATTQYGAPQRCWWLVTLDIDGGMNATLFVQNKTATRHGEALFVRFNPLAAEVQLNSLGQWSPVEPNSTMDGGSKLMRAVDSGVRFSAPTSLNSDTPLDSPTRVNSRAARSTHDRWLSVDSLDAAVAVLGQPSGFDSQYHCMDRLRSHHPTREATDCPCSCSPTHGGLGIRSGSRSVGRAKMSQLRRILPFGFVSAQTCDMVVVVV